MTDPKKISLASILGNLALGGLAIGATYLAIRNKDTIAQTFGPAATRLGDSFRNMMAAARAKLVPQTPVAAE